MIKERVHPNDEAATDLAAAIIANAAAFHKEASRLYGDVGRLHTKVEATHREVDRLHRKNRRYPRPNSNFSVAKSHALPWKCGRVSTNRYQAAVKSD